MTTLNFNTIDLSPKRRRIRSKIKGEMYITPKSKKNRYIYFTVYFLQALQASKGDKIRIARDTNEPGRLWVAKCGPEDENGRVLRRVSAENDTLFLLDDEILENYEGNFKWDKSHINHAGYDWHRVDLAIEKTMQIFKAGENGK